MQNLLSTNFVSLFSGQGTKGWFEVPWGPQDKKKIQFHSESLKKVMILFWIQPMQLLKLHRVFSSD